MNRNYDAGPRARANNFFDVGVVGRRTGITMKANIKKDADGLDNIDDFWKDDDQSDQDNNQNYDGDRSPPQRMSSPPQRQYLEQELPEELLSTPTSRRLRNVPISRGSASSSMGLSLPGGNMYDNTADEYQSPSFHAVKKRLVFTNDSSDIEPDQGDFQPATIQTKDLTTSSSPSLDKLLSASWKKKAQIKANVALSSPINTLARPTTSTAVSSRPQMTSAAASQRAGKPKAFDLGGDFTDQDDQDDNINQLNNDAYNFNDVDDATQDGLDAPIPATPKRSSHKQLSTIRTPAEFKRKTKIALESKTKNNQSEDEGYDYIEHEPEDEVDDRLRFSDEDEPFSRRVEENDDEDQEEEEEEIQATNRRAMDPVQKKRTASTKEPKSNNRSKMAAATSKYIPKGTKSTSDPATRTKGQKPSTKISRAGNVEDTDEDDRRVPFSTQKKSTSGKSKSTVATAAPKKSKSSANKISSVSDGRGARNTSYESKRSREIPVELVEVPIVPDVGTDDQGVRRSHRTKITPLEFWKNERVVIEKDSASVPVIKAVLRAPPEESLPKGSKRKRATGSSSSKRGTVLPLQRRRQKQTQATEEEDEIDSSLEEYVDNSRNGMGLKDEVANKRAEVLVFGTDKVTSQVIAESKDSLQFRDVEGGEYLFHRGLEDANSLASGIIKIKPGGRKPTINSNGSSMVFFVIKGLVQVTVHETEFVVSTGGRFLVPSGNQYGISNLSKKDSLLFFTRNKANINSNADLQLSAPHSDNEESSKHVANEAAKRLKARGRRSIPKSPAATVSTSPGPSQPEV
ncbi:hypothetical protein BGX27_000569 [Mortierella sp. AM989]|nr:hypothetical protein BGX27_000569 [Mortierella sp. AM989]